MSDGHVEDVPALSVQPHTKKTDLVKKFNAIDRTRWKEEKDMYPDIIEAMQSTLYSKAPGVFVVDTHDRGDFRPDISVADFQDDRLVYCLWYFIELKLSGSNLLAPDHCGQLLDYFHKSREKQRHRREFMGILSNFDSAWVFTARYEAETVTIFKRSAPTLADALLYADAQSRLQYTKRIPVLNTRFSSEYTILAVAKHHFLVRVPLPVSAPTSIPTRPVARSAIVTRSQMNQAEVSSHDPHWRSPSRHRVPAAFVLKIVHGDTSVANEIKILRKIRDIACSNLPELVWAPDGGKELGIVPVGHPIDFRQVASVSRKIVEGVVDGLEHLHAHGIVHRDIRPSNLVLDHKNNVVIIDYETSVILTHDTTADYLGGFICWPKRLLEYNTAHYIPDPTDDLFACILVVLHLLFPSWFDAFRASSIRISRVGQTHNVETKRLLGLWKDIEHSAVWGPFAKAAKDRDYTVLKGMADVFCHL